MLYLMSPELYDRLTYVRGFTTANGKSYQEHITIILDKNLNNEQKTNILNTNDITNALNLLNDYEIKYSHDPKYWHDI